MHVSSSAEALLTVASWLFRQSPPAFAGSRSGKQEVPRPRDLAEAGLVAGCRGCNDRVAPTHGTVSGVGIGWLDPHRDVGHRLARKAGPWLRRKFRAGVGVPYAVSGGTSKLEHLKRHLGRRACAVALLRAAGLGEPIRAAGAECAADASARSANRSLPEHVAQRLIVRRVTFGAAFPSTARTGGPGTGQPVRPWRDGGLRRVGALTRAQGGSLP